MKRCGPCTMRIGVAGWDYADWVGAVYPSGAGRGLDRLAYVSRFVDVLEINSTFYRPVASRTAEAWVRRTAARGEGFRFSAKAHRSWSHDPRPPGASDLDATLDGLRPLREAGRLCALLVQFPQSFHYDERARARLEGLAARLAGWPVVIEVRHAGWQRPEAARWFAGIPLGWCVVDQPLVGRSSALPVPRVTRDPAYLRLHGRNRDAWFREDAGRDARYDYLYSTGEVRELASTARAMAEQAAELVVVQNNHFRGQALVNALELKHLLQGERPPAPEILVRTYPSLADSVRVERSRLF
jgi:uncharacterized protein YecE (DUF72 family)